MMDSLDRLPVARDLTVSCPLRAETVALSRCAECGHAERLDPADPPRYVVCDARYVLGWLGMDVDS